MGFGLREVGFQDQDLEPWVDMDKVDTLKEQLAINQVPA